MVRRAVPRVRRLGLAVGSGPTRSPVAPPAARLVPRPVHRDLDRQRPVPPTLSGSAGRPTTAVAPALTTVATVPIAGRPRSPRRAIAAAATRRAGLTSAARSTVVDHRGLERPPPWSSSRRKPQHGVCPPRRYRRAGPRPSHAPSPSTAAGSSWAGHPGAACATRRLRRVRPPCGWAARPSTTRRGPSESATRTPGLGTGLGYHASHDHAGRGRSSARSSGSHVGRSGRRDPHPTIRLSTAHERRRHFEVRATAPAATGRTGRLLDVTLAAASPGLGRQSRRQRRCADSAPAD